MTHPFIMNKQVDTIQLTDRGAFSLWLVVTEALVFNMNSSMFGSLYKVGDEIGIVTIKGPYHWMPQWIKKTEIGRFLELYELDGHYVSPRYVLKGTI